MGSNTLRTIRNTDLKKDLQTYRRLTLIILCIDKAYSYATNNNK